MHDLTISKPSLADRTLTFYHGAEGVEVDRELPKELDGIRSFIDVGSSVGVLTVIAHALNVRRLCTHITAVEPTPEAYVYLLWNLHVNNIPYTTDAIAPSACGRVRALRSVEARGVGSAPLLANTESPVGSLNVLLTVHAEPVQLLSLDCAGCALAMLRELEESPALLSRVRAGGVNRVTGELDGCAGTGSFSHYMQPECERAKEFLRRTWTSNHFFWLSEESGSRSRAGSLYFGAGAFDASAAHVAQAEALAASRMRTLDERLHDHYTRQQALLNEMHLRVDIAVLAIASAMIIISLIVTCGAACCCSSKNGVKSSSWLASASTSASLPTSASQVHLIPIGEVVYP